MVITASAVVVPACAIANPLPTASVAPASVTNLLLVVAAFVFADASVASVVIYVLGLGSDRSGLVIILGSSRADWVVVSGSVAPPAVVEGSVTSLFVLFDVSH